MDRRGFLKSSAVGAIGASWISTSSAYATENIEAVLSRRAQFYDSIKTLKGSYASLSVGSDMSCPRIIDLYECAFRYDQNAGFSVFGKFYVNGLNGEHCFFAYQSNQTRIVRFNGKWDSTKNHGIIESKREFPADNSISNFLNILLYSPLHVQLSTLAAAKGSYIARENPVEDALRQNPQIVLEFTEPFGDKKIKKIIIDRNTGATIQGELSNGVFQMSRYNDEENSAAGRLICKRCEIRPAFPKYQDEPLVLSGSDAFVASALKDLSINEPVNTEDLNLPSWLNA